MTLPLSETDDDDQIETTSPEAEDDLESGYVPEQDDAPLSIPPIDRRLVTQPIDLTVRTIAAQIDDNTLLVQPDYQRRYVWDDRRASRLIEVPAEISKTKMDWISDNKNRLIGIARHHFTSNSTHMVRQVDGNFF